ncbi:MAG: hypothetical protein ACJ8GN_20985 [Longimicrobiaceae bacterium]
MDHRYLVDARRYSDSTIGLLRNVPQQRPDPIAQRDAVSNLGVIQSRLEHLDPALRDLLAEPLQEALAAAQAGQLGLTLAYMESVQKVLKAAEDASAASS